MTLPLGILMFSFKCINERAFPIEITSNLYIKLCSVKEIKVLKTSFYFTRMKEKLLTFIYRYLQGKNKP